MIGKFEVHRYLRISLDQPPLAVVPCQTMGPWVLWSYLIPRDVEMNKKDRVGWVEWTKLVFVDVTAASSELFSMGTTVWVNTGRGEVISASSEKGLLTVAKHNYHRLWNWATVIWLSNRTQWSTSSNCVGSYMKRAQELNSRVHAEVEIYSTRSSNWTDIYSFSRARDIKPKHQ